MFLTNWHNTQVTVELRELVENGVDVWAFDYPTYYQGEEKKAFEKKVLDHYWTRQIGQETAGRWLHYFRTRIREIMPYYIQLYKSQALMESLEDPFGNVNVTETFEQFTTGSSTGSTSSEDNGSTTSEDNGTASTTGSQGVEKDNTHVRKFSNTPQGSIDNLDNYLTEATQETDNGSEDTTTSSQTTSENNGTTTTQATGSTTSQGSEEGTTRHTLTRKGNQGVNTYAHDMKELRETFLNIDLMVINELKDLFLMVY